MTFKLGSLLLVLAVLMVLVTAQRRRQNTRTNDEWNYRDGADRVNMRGVANLTQVLDDWRFDILNQMKGLLQNDHQTLLPDYSRIQPLSEALDDLFKEFNALKERLGELTEKFTTIESFIDEVKASRANTGGQASAPSSGAAAGPASGPIQRQGGRRVIRKKTAQST
uniref:Si:ch211-76l23.4 n=1 Tax=Cyprinodon variegatus TaxID=28743 RepID=A0A3Q2CG23_CYPVA